MSFGEPMFGWFVRETKGNPTIFAGTGKKKRPTLCLLRETSGRISPTQGPGPSTCWALLSPQKRLWPSPHKAKPPKKGSKEELFCCLETSLRDWGTPFCGFQLHLESASCEIGKRDLRQHGLGCGLCTIGMVVKATLLLP